MTTKCAPVSGHPALVLSGGAILGALQVGILKALFQAALTPSLIIGTSAGALNGAFIAFHPDSAGVEKLERIWRNVRASAIFNRNPFHMAHTLLSRKNCVFGNDYLHSLVHRQLPVDDFNASHIPLYVTATDLTSGEKRIFHRGKVSDAVLASTAIPGLFCPVEIDGRTYVDGAIMANLDLETAVDLGAKEILAIDVSGPHLSFRADNILGVLTRSLDLMMREQVRRDLERLSSHARIAVIHPQLDHEHPITAFPHVPHLIEEGERLGRQLLGRCLDRRGGLRPGLVVN